MKKLILFGLLALPLVAYAEGDGAKGKAKAVMCAACHGVEGVSAIAIYPNLAGQKEAYLVSSMKAYKDGNRKGGNAAVMVPMASMLTDADIANLAAYYSSL